ncbi:hypothetical protein BDQ17DRAFT_1548418 [Cyathus striatus]|nr:hypothetical protein BDQ17DRAFT_1548418 [Cyathus striatus]
MSSKTQLSLRGSLVPTDAVNLSVEDKSNMLEAIAGLHKLSEDMERYQRERKFLPLKSSDLNKYWKAGLFSWFKFLFDHYHPPLLDSHFPSRREVITYVSCVFAYFVNTDTRLVSSAAGVPQLATRLWLVTDYDYERSEYSLYCGWWAPFIGVMMNTRGMDPRFRSKIYDVEGVTKRVLVNLILKRLISSTETDFCSYQQYSRLLGILSNFDAYDPSLGVLVNRIVRCMTSTVEAMVLDVCTYDEEPGVGIVDACLQFLDILQLTLESANSIDAVCEAIRSGLLVAFIFYSPYFKWLLKNDADPRSLKPMIDKAVTIITSTLPKFMVYSSVLSAIEDVLKGNNFDSDMSKTMVAREWNTFCRLFDNKMKYLNRELPRLSFCDNPKHDVHSKSEKMWQCSGCKSAWYCSQKCQKENWVDFHRDVCPLSRKSKDTSTHSTLRKRDHTSVCRFAITTTAMQWGAIEDMAQKEYPGQALSQLAIVFDYTQHPHSVRVIMKDHAATIISRHMPNSIVIQCLVPLGMHRATITTAGDIDEVETKDWITGQAYITYVAGRRAIDAEYHTV